MSQNYFRIKKGLSLDNTQASAVSVKGDLAYNTSTDKVELYNGAVDPLVTEAKASTLTNKTISGSSNTLSNVAYSSLVLSNSIVNADISSSAAIVYSKLSLANSIANSDLAVMNSNTIKGNNTGGSTNPTNLTVSQVNTMLGTTLANGTVAFTGDQSMGSHKLTNVTDPTSAQDAATKAYVDNVAAGINPAVAVQAATTSSSSLSGYTYNNGVSGIGATLTAGSSNTALTVDGYTFTALGQRLLVKDQTTSANNGVYYVTQVQAFGLPVILTRALDYDTPSDMNNTGAIPVENGTVNAITMWVLTSLVTTVGTDPVTFTKFSRNPADYLLAASNLSDVASKTTAFNNLSPSTTKGDIIAYSGSNNIRVGVGTDGQVLVGDSSQTSGVNWTTLQQGSKNYVTYNNFENNATTGWSLGTVGTLTNGLPTGTPTFGSGASGNLSIATTATSIAGTYSLNYVSSAATTQGNMLATQSYAIDAEDQAKVLTIRFYYKAASNPSNCNFSGTSSNSFAWAVWDVTNSAWLTSAGNFNLVQSSGCGYVTGTCQTGATTANIRLVVYNANATSGAATITFDDFYVGPQTAPSGPAVGDWNNNLTFAVSAGFGTITNSSIYSRRVGDSLEVHGSFTAGTVAGSSANITLPVTIDSTKLGAIANGEQIGAYAGTVSGASSGLYSGGNASIVFYDGSTTNQVFFALNTASNAYVKANGNSITASSSPFSFYFTIPVSGWSSNSVSSSDTDTRVVALIVTGQPQNSYTTDTALIFPTVSKDTHGAYNASTGAYTAPVTGFYDIHGMVNYSTQGAATSMYATVAGVTQNPYMGTSGAANTPCAGFTTVYANAGQAIDVRINGGASTINDKNGLTIVRRSGPAVVTATESVNASYGLNAAVTPSANAVIKYDTKIFDSHNAFSTSTGLYTCPASGKYMVSGTACINTATASLYATVNGTGKNYLCAANANNATLTQGFSTMVSCNAGDTIGIFIDASKQLNGISSSIYQNVLNIARLGN